MTYRRIAAACPVSMTMGAILGVSTATPALAAPLDVVLAGRDPLLFGSIALLVVGIVLRVAARRRRVEPSAPPPDLRWWKNAES